MTTAAETLYAILTDILCIYTANLVSKGHWRKPEHCVLDETLSFIDSDLLYTGVLSCRFGCIIEYKGNVTYIQIHV